jgi:hypothetical protein
MKLFIVVAIIGLILGVYAGVVMSPEPELVENPEVQNLEILDCEVQDVTGKLVCSLTESR